MTGSKLLCVAVSGVFLAIAASTPPAIAKTNENGKYFDDDGVITYNVQPDGTVDWYTYSGFRRYHSECHVCHGPDGLGSTYAPALVESLKHMDFYDFSDVVINGRKVVNSAKDSVMPSFGTNVNVACYLEDIYAYLKARSDGALGRGRPAKREDKPQAAKDAEAACRGDK